MRKYDTACKKTTLEWIFGTVGLPSVIYVGFVGLAGASSLNASPDASQAIMKSISDYRKFSQEDKSNPEYFEVPKELEIFGDDQKLKDLYFRFGGLSIGLGGVSEEKKACQQSEDGGKFGGVLGCHEFAEKLKKIISESRDGSEFGKINFSVEENRLILKPEEEGNVFVSLLAMKRFVESINQDYRPVLKNDKDRTAEKLMPFEDKACVAAKKKAESRLQIPENHLFPERYDYILSRAVIPAQRICGFKKKQESGQCTIPEIFRVELIHGYIGEVAINGKKYHEINSDSKEQSTKQEGKKSDDVGGHENKDKEQSTKQEGQKLDGLSCRK
ncbi:MAG: hypothetical protein HQM00_03830, partial [Magnetococcales bacterium]|nr:hypothetical protein [Magnetococcales bacterium]